MYVFQRCKELFLCQGRMGNCAEHKRARGKGERKGTVTCWGSPQLSSGCCCCWSSPSKTSLGCSRWGTGRVQALGSCSWCSICPQRLGTELCLPWQNGGIAPSSPSRCSAWPGSTLVPACGKDFLREGSKFAPTLVSLVMPLPWWTSQSHHSPCGVGSMLTKARKLLMNLLTWKGCSFKKT